MATNMIKLCALRATDLPDVDIWPKNPAADSYVRLYLLNSQWQTVAGPSISAQIDNNNSPTWNHCAILNPQAAAYIIRIQVIDDDLFGEETVGYVGCTPRRTRTFDPRC